MNYLPIIGAAIVLAYLTWITTNYVLHKIFKVEKAMSEAVAYALTMIVPLLSLYIFGSIFAGK